MNMFRFVFGTAASLTLILAPFAPAPQARGEEGWGTITGQILYDGEEVPQSELLFAKGTKVKDQAVCAAVDHYSKELLVDEETKGVKNVVIFIHYAKARGMKVHPDLKESKKKEVVFDQKNCTFIPHVMVVRTDQTVVMKSQDNCAHNIHTNTIFNPEFNALMPPNFEEGLRLDLERPETLPMPVKCDIHPWMKAHWLVIDHPYATVTDEKGRFTIEKLPAGEVEFRIWHERAGYIDRKFVVDVPSGDEKELDPLVVPAEKFAK